MNEIAASLKLHGELVSSSLARLHVLANPMVWLVFLRQIYYTAVRSLRLLSVVAVIVGGTIVASVTEVMGGDLRLYDIVELVLVRHAAPLAAAVIVIGRSATAISCELGNLRIPVLDYLIVPRVAAVTLATVGCCFYFQLISVVGGFAVAAMMLDVTLLEELRRFAETVSIGAMALEVLKSVCFGFLIAAIACASGLNAAPRTTEVPLVPARAFLRSLVAVLAVDALFLSATV
jgi:phospholipid/cholesterol/gamma-HCH transport system permease protein